MDEKSFYIKCLDLCCPQGNHYGLLVIFLCSPFLILCFGTTYVFFEYPIIISISLVVGSWKVENWFQYLFWLCICLYTGVTFFPDPLQHDVWMWTWPGIGKPWWKESFDYSLTFVFIWPAPYPLCHSLFWRVSRIPCLLSCFPEISLLTP